MQHFLGLLAILTFPAIVWGEEKNSSGILCEGLPWAVKYYLRDSGAAGPTVMIVGGIHGNEPAGTIAAGDIRKWSIQRGKLIVIPRANEMGLKVKQRRMQGIADDLSDLNRDFPKSGETGPPRGPLAMAIWKLVKQQKPLWLIDLHEANKFRRLNEGSVGNSILLTPTAATKKTGRRLCEAANAAILEEAKKFTLGRAPKDGTLARAVAEHLGINALLIETTKQEQPLKLRIDQHELMVRKLLKTLGM